ncbi:MAG TPA: TolC family protein [Gemmatales bacterium]|nr:TolC family protein [Gemmatales bacterium]
MLTRNSTHTTGAGRWKRGFATLAILTGCGVLAHGQEPPRLGTLPAAAVASTKRVYNLDEAVALALAQQPAVAAARASLASVQTARDAAYTPLAGILGGGQICIRRQQADLGVAIAMASIEQAELETFAAVSRSYLSVVYARAQLEVAEEAVSTLRRTADIARDLVDRGSKEVTKSDLDRLETYRLIAESKAGEARLGMTRAKAALAEAIGLDHCNDFDIGDESLAQFHDAFLEFGAQRGRKLSTRVAVETALNQRPELRQSSMFAQVTGLEIQAQGRTIQPYARTFAATGDIHSKILPATVMNGEYRPGPVGPEMPSFLAGTPRDRQQRASHLYQRSLAVDDKAQGLVKLEVEEACARLDEQLRQIALLRQAIQQTKKQKDDAERYYRNDQLKTEQLLTIQLLDSQTRAQLNEAYFKFGQSLGVIQRATGGNLWNCFVEQDK